MCLVSPSLSESLLLCPDTILSAAPTASLLLLLLLLLCWRLRSKRFDGMLAPKCQHQHAHVCVSVCVGVCVPVRVCVSCNGPIALLKSTQFYF